MKNAAKKFQQRILSWFDQHGRKELPWQQHKTPYRVWISEIMLQQTQVQTVIPYFARFMAKFPDIHQLAAAKEDEVLHLWSGLGYYNRARMLHKTAKIIATQFDHQLPDNIEELTKLPGIGTSTAGAILSIAFKQPAPILDGNVKRVLARLHALFTPINTAKAEKELWELAAFYMPNQRVDDYTQAIMDLGATLCTRKNPQCTHCPLKKDCQALQQGVTELLPIKNKTKNRPTHAITFLVLQHEKKILLRKRPPLGIWGGLWSLPEIHGPADEKIITQFCRQHFHIQTTNITRLNELRHSFSHYHLNIFPVLIKLRTRPAKIMEANEQIWYNPEQPNTIGLAKPISSIIKGIV